MGVAEGKTVAVGFGVFVGVAVGGTCVAVDGMGVAVDGTCVAVGGMSVVSAGVVVEAPQAFRNNIVSTQQTISRNDLQWFIVLTPFIAAQRANALLYKLGDGTRSLFEIRTDFETPTIHNNWQNPAKSEYKQL